MPSLRTRIETEVRRFPAAYWRLWSMILVSRTGAFVLPFLMLFLTTRRGFSLATAGTLLSVFGAGSISAALLGGQLADRWGRRPTTLLSMFGGALAVAALGLVTTPLAIFAMTFVFGLLSELYRPALSASVSDLVAPEDQSSAFAHIYWAHNLGFALAPVTAGWVAASFGFPWLFVVNALAALTCGAWAWRAIPESQPARVRVIVPRAIFQWGALRDRRLVWFLAAFAPIPLLMLQTVSVLPVLMRDDGVSPADYGKILSINGALIVLLQPWLIARLSGVRRTPVLIVGASALGLGFMGHALANSLTGHVLALLLWTLGEISVVPMAAGVVAELAPIEARGRYQGMYGMTWSFAHLASPWLGTLALAQLGVLGWGLGCACAGACSAVLYVVFGAVLAQAPKTEREQAE